MYCGAHNVSILVKMAFYLLTAAIAQVVESPLRVR